jgi:hypothetical protein
MIRRQRAAHLRTWIALAVVIAVAFAVSLTIKRQTQAALQSSVETGEAP